MQLSLSLLVLCLAVAMVYLLWWRGRGPRDGDAQVVLQLKKAGSDISKPHDIEFFLYFATEASAQHTAEKMRGLGFQPEVKAAADGATMPWLVFATRRMVPELSELHRLRASLNILAASENGEFDGWGTPVVQ